MNLLQLLLGSLTSNDSVNSMSKKTGVSSKMTSKLLMMAIPLLISYMTKNASKKEGAQSLLGALTQHNSKETVANQVANADAVDGAKIIGHILGQDQNTVINNLAKESGASAAEVNTILSNIAPALLSSLSTATNSTAAKQTSGVNLADGIDLSDVMGLLGGVKQSSSSAATSLLGSLLGGTSNKKNDVADLTNVLGTLLGGTSNAKTSKKDVDGTELLGLLTALMNK